MVAPETAVETPSLVLNQHFFPDVSFGDDLVSSNRDIFDRNSPVYVGLAR